MNKNDIITASGINTALSNLQTEIQGLKLTKVWENTDSPQASEFTPRTITINEIVSEYIIYYRHQGSSLVTGFCHKKVMEPASGPNQDSISITETDFNTSTLEVRLDTITRNYYVYPRADGTTTFQFLACSHFIVRVPDGGSAIFSGGETNKWIFPLAIYKVGDIYSS